ncbi:RDD domain containing protein [Kribbella flavida DSM 17836]|uniref:RDD domain containing protein n=1 Tax=Kribbella flavida (strain DSM 17836 / JCM 10339 / NBRC 14399) TaxID=479435 RepID=D2PMG0_KRIFD|nr:RDD family protein [Kribbella flavida]ADB30704.1 RDD domain containing protein [Kribbella flavida DSM 17836]
MSQLVTGEAVVLQVRIARMPTRALACAIDFALQVIVLIILFATLFGFLIGGASEALGAALTFVILLLVLVGYRVVMETLTRGRTIGKLMLGLRVVRDDGSSIRFRHALVRALLWVFVDFAPWFAAGPGIVASLMNKQGKRIGDMVAGTVVIRERHQPMASPPLFVPGHLVQWAQSLELSRLTDDLANTSREYLARYKELEPQARVALGDALAFKVGGLTAPAPPVPVSSPAFLSAVLAERRRRELSRLAANRPTGHTGPFAPANPYAQPQSFGAPSFPTQSPYGAAPAGPPYAAPQGVPYGGQPQYGAAPTGPGLQYGVPPAGPGSHIPPGAPQRPYGAGPGAPQPPYGAGPGAPQYGTPPGGSAGTQSPYRPAPGGLQDVPPSGAPQAPAAGERPQDSRVNAEGWHAPGGDEAERWS